MHTRRQIPFAASVRPWFLGPWLLALAAGCAATRPGEGPLSEFDFLEGTWARTDAQGTVEEVWTSNGGWSLRGAGRTLDEGREVGRAAFAILPRGKSYVYVAAVAGAPSVEFALVDHGIDWARFENRANPFPQRVEYRRDGSGLRAERSSVEGGRTLREVTEFRRVARR
jgi:hypothetical protein